MFYRAVLLFDLKTFRFSSKCKDPPPDLSCNKKYYSKRHFYFYIYYALVVVQFDVRSLVNLKKSFIFKNDKCLAQLFQPEPWPVQYQLGHMLSPLRQGISNFH